MLPNTQIKTLQSLMNASIRFIYSITVSDEYSIIKYMKKCHFMPVRARIDFKVRMLVYKVFNGMAPNYIVKLLCSKESLQSHRVSSDTLLLHKRRPEKTNKLNRRFSIAASTVWNKLPLNIRNCASLSLFKAKPKP